MAHAMPKQTNTENAEHKQLTAICWYMPILDTGETEVSELNLSVI